MPARSALILFEEKGVFRFAKMAAGAAAAGMPAPGAAGPAALNRRSRRSLAPHRRGGGVWKAWTLMGFDE